MAGAAAGGCSVEEQSPPSFVGPSEFALSVTLSATPDQLPRDGTSQSVITVTVRDASNRPVSGQRLSVSSSIGTVSQSEVVTDSEGRATFAFVAPPSSAIGSTAIIEVIPVDAANTTARRVSILLTGTPNRTAPTPDFSVTPEDPDANVAVTFDASATTDEGVACLDACTYSWDFGGGSTATGRIVNHTFTTARTHTVTLTVTDAAGASASKIKEVTVARVAPPTVTLAVAPNPPLAGQQATFTATATPASGHSIVSYSLNFGDGTSQTTTAPSVTKTYSSVGTYVATVTVTDDVGQTASVSLQFTITGSGVTASFTVSPTKPVIDDNVRFNGASSTAPAGATTTRWQWNFGDGGTEDETDPTTSHRFSAARTYVVRLTVTDSAGRTGTTTQNVEVSKPD